MIPFLVDLMVLGSLWGLGVLVVKVIVPSSARLERFALGYPLGSGLYSFVLFILGWLGLTISKISTVIVFCILFIGALIYSHRKAVINTPPKQYFEDQEQQLNSIDKWIWAVIGALLLISFIISVGRSYSAYDAAAEWAVEGYGISHEGSVYAGQEWGMWGISYPLNTKLQVATFMIFGQEKLPGSKLLYPAYLVSLVLGCYYFWRSNRVNRGLAGLAALFLLTNPVLYIHGTNGYVNVAFTAAIILGVLQLVAGNMDDNVQRQLLSGVLLGIAVWTRPEGIGFSIGVALSFLIFSKLKKRKFAPIPVFVPILISSMWMLFAWGGVSEGQLGTAIKSMLSGLAKGDYHWFELYFIPRIFIERAIAPENWGAFIPVVGLLVLTAWITRKSYKNLMHQFILIVVILFCVIPVGIYYAVSYEPFDDQFVNVLRRDFDRAFLPAFTALTIYAIALWEEQPPALLQENEPENTIS